MIISDQHFRIVAPALLWLLCHSGLEIKDEVGRGFDDVSSDGTQVRIIRRRKVLLQIVHHRPPYLISTKGARRFNPSSRTNGVHMLMVWA